MSMHDTYFEYCETYQKKYGAQAIVLIECGSFFEIYAVDNETVKAGPSNIYAICDLCNLQLSRKNKSILENSRSNPLMAGFPSYALQRHAQTLLNHQYTLVIVRQVTAPPNPRREVTEVMSPGVNVNVQGMDTSYLMVVYCDTHTDKLSNRHLNLGISGIDITTGHCWVYEVASSIHDPNLALDELVRMHILYSPKEIMVIDNGLDAKEFKLIKDTLGFDTDAERVFHNMDAASVSYFGNVSYQNAVLEKVYNADSMLSPLERLSIERLDNARIAFCYAIQFVFEHNESVLKNMNIPTLISANHHCIIEYNSTAQLQLVGQSNERPLLTILNRCSTAFGARYFKQQLLQPLTDTKRITERYDCIQEIINANVCGKVSNSLKKVMDLERMGRRMTTGLFQPCDWPSFHSSLECISQACVCAGDRYKSTGVIIERVQAYYTDILNLEECGKYLMQEIKGNIFKSENATANKLDIYIKKLNTVAKSIYPDDGCRVDYNERDGHHFVITKKRWDTVKGTLKTLDMDGAKLDLTAFCAKPLSSSSTMYKLSSVWVEGVSNNILRWQATLNVEMTEEYKRFLQHFADTAVGLISELVDAVAKLDFVATCAKNAQEFRYTRPVLDTNNTSFVKASSIRHPILERIRQDTEYISNDIDMCENGLLLFGVNASGKSSLMKAIGLNVIMAQAGMFVAAERFELGVYKHIFTRISGSDNIYRGWSTFMVEMMELRNILQRADRRSLVLGDELCSGTESLSALAIVAAGIDSLCKNKVAFVFATHLHDLSKLNIIKNNSAVRVMHMHVEVSPEGYLIFDRTLRPGTGSSTYGLEVCHGLGMPPEFLKLAHDTRCEIEGRAKQIVNPVKSRYNSKVFKDTCSICGNVATEIHHIKEQHTADERGFIGAEHKNRESNLVALCGMCHDKTHSDGLRITKVQTSKGKRVATKKQPSNSS